MNISTNQKVILEPLKEVPQEVLFKSNSPKNAMRDQNKINRIWFSFPEQWANQLNKDSIIGFRNFYIVKEDRYIVFNLDITVYENLGLEERNTLFSLSGKQRFWIGHVDSLTKIPYIFEEFWYQNMKTIIVNNEVANEQLNNKNLIDCMLINNGLIFKHALHQDKLEYEDEDGKHECHLAIHITPLNEDCKNVFNISSNRVIGDDELEFKVWTRHTIYLTSSISYEAEDNFLGHTNYSCNPIKYYRLTNNDKKFWVDMWESRNHNIPVEFPYDGKEVLYIEGIVCFDSKAMI